MAKASRRTVENPLIVYGRKSPLGAARRGVLGTAAIGFEGDRKAFFAACRSFKNGSS
jgi:hypothetical protein